MTMSDQGYATAEFTCATVAAVATALVLHVIVFSPWFARSLARPFGLALSWLF